MARGAWLGLEWWGLLLCSADLGKLFRFPRRHLHPPNASSFEPSARHSHLEILDYLEHSTGFGSTSHVKPGAVLREQRTPRTVWYWVARHSRDINPEHLRVAHCSLWQPNTRHGDRPRDQPPITKQHRLQNGRTSTGQAHPGIDQGCHCRSAFCRHWVARGAEG